MKTYPSTKSTTVFWLGFRLNHIEQTTIARHVGKSWILDIHLGKKYYELMF